MRKAKADKALAPPICWGKRRARSRPLKLATWNVNSIRARLDAVLRWLETEQPDVLCMQETKVEDDEFPSDELQMLGYAVAMAGQPTYNGVAIASRLPMKDIQIGLLDAAPDAGVQLASGVLESSNVNVANAMVKMIELSRQFDLQVKAMRTAEENAATAAQLLRAT